MNFRETGYVSCHAPVMTGHGKYKFIPNNIHFIFLICRFFPRLFLSHDINQPESARWRYIINRMQEKNLYKAAISNPVKGFRTE